MKFTKLISVLAIILTLAEPTAALKRRLLKRVLSHEKKLKIKKLYLQLEANRLYIRNGCQSKVETSVEDVLSKIIAKSIELVENHYYFAYGVHCVKSALHFATANSFKKQESSQNEGSDKQKNEVYKKFKGVLERTNCLIKQTQNKFPKNDYEIIHVKNKNEGDNKELPIKTCTYLREQFENELAKLSK